MICKFFRLLLLKCWCLQGLGLGVCAKQYSSGSGIERQMLICLHSVPYTESLLQLSCKKRTRRIHESLYEFCTVRRSKSSSISNLNVWFYYYAHSCSKYCNFKDFYLKTYGMSGWFGYDRIIYYVAILILWKWWSVVNTIASSAEPSFFLWLYVIFNAERKATAQQTINNVFAHAVQPSGRTMFVGRKEEVERIYHKNFCCKQFKSSALWLFRKRLLYSMLKKVVTMYTHGLLREDTWNLDIFQ